MTMGSLGAVVIAVLGLSGTAIQASPSPQEPARVTNGGPIRAPRKIKDVQPKYPDNALRAGLKGDVVLECTIGANGNVVSVKVISGYKSLATAATDAVRKWTFTPTLVDGVAVPVIMTETTRFSFQGAPSQGDLIKSIADRDPDIRTAAVQWLGTLKPGNEKQRKAIEAALQDPDPAVKEAASKALSALSQ